MTFEAFIYGLGAAIILIGITQEIIIRKRSKKWKSKTLKK